MKYRLKDQTMQAKLDEISGGDFLLWQLKKSVKVKENTSKLLDFCPGKAKTSQKLLISLHFSVLSGKNRLI